MTGRERLLSIVLVVCAFLALAFFGVMYYLDQSAELRSSIDNYRHQLRLLHEEAIEPVATPAVAQFRREVEKLERRLYEPGEMDVYRFGGLVRGVLQENGVSISRYHTVARAGEELVEFVGDGDVAEIVGALRDLSSQEKAWRVSFLSIQTREGSTEASVTVRVGYETIPSNTP